MNRTQKPAFTVLVVFALLTSLPLLARGEEYYKDKTIRFLVAYSAGGSFDSYTRLIARHFGRHVPGNPRTMVENMTGAGGMIAANHLYNRTAADGLTIGAFAAPVIFQQIMGSKAAQFDGRRFGWLGLPTPIHQICIFNRQSGIKTMDDWVNAKQPLKIGSIGPGTATSDVPKILDAALGLPIRAIEGYKGGGDVRLAVESGEVEGYCGTWEGARRVWKDAFDSGTLHVVLQITNKPHPELKNIPLAINYAKTQEARELLRVAVNVHGNQFTYSVPPGVPNDRLELLQKAFTDSLNDPALQAEAGKGDLALDPIDGKTTDKEISSLYELSPDVLKKLRAILRPGK